MGSKNIIRGFMIGATTFTLGISLARWALSPKQVYVQEVDFNQDGVSDLVIEKRQGHKVPMYGVHEGEDTRYISASEMRKRNPESIIDYEAIESNLNNAKRNRFIPPQTPPR